MMLNPKTLEAMRVLEERILHSLLAERHGREEDPNSAAATEHADEGIALAARDLVDAIDVAHPDEWPVGWFCGEVQLRRQGSGPFPVFGAQCRLRPKHDGPHDWEQAGLVDQLEAARAMADELRDVNAKLRNRLTAVDRYADQLRADADREANDAVAVGLLRAADGLGDLHAEAVNA